ncbi:MAG TPA: hypothetical protein VLA02_13765 [Reyranella sp.]|nr:hypothetical protein [Reyranella sp.]
MSGDPDQEYFADGVTEDIITELSRFHELFVIARNSSFTYKGRAVDVRTVAADLGVRYVLEGSVRKATTRIRVTGQLIDALTGNHIWADRFDRELEDVFAVQEELTQSIVSAITPHIDEAEVSRVRRRRPDNLTAYEIAVRANAKAWESYVKADRALRNEAIGEAQAALAIDARSTLALNTIALAHAQHIVLMTADRETSWRDGLAAATRSVEADRGGGIGHTWKGVFLALALDRSRIAEALANARRGHELNPHAMLSLFGLAFVEVQASEPAQAIEHARQGLRISPRDPFCHMLHHQAARASFCLGRYADGVRHALLGINEAPDHPLLYTVLAACHVGLGEVDKARTVLETVRQLAPELVAQEGAGWGTTDDEYRRRYRTFMRIAIGAEEPGAADALR